MTNIIKNRNAAPAAFGSVLDQLFPKNVTNHLDDAFWGFGSPLPSSVAPVNIRETRDGYELELAAPGLRKSDFLLKIDGDTLTVSVEQRGDQKPEDGEVSPNPVQKDEHTQQRWIRQEFSRQPFQRHFELGDSIDREKISARYDSGILFLTLPKKENVRPASRQIDIS